MIFKNLLGQTLFIYLIFNLLFNLQLWSRRKKRFPLCRFLIISRKRVKARAPSPPQAPQPAPRNIFRTPEQEGGNLGADAKENILRPRVHLQVTLPQGHQTSLTEDGR